MKSAIGITFFCLWGVFFVTAQDANPVSFSKYPIESTGCSVYLPAVPPAWSVSFSEDSSAVYTNSVEYKDFIFDVIMVNFKVPFTGESHEVLEELLISYLDFLKEAYETDNSSGYGLGQVLPGNDDVLGVLDFWESADGTQSKVKGWITDTHLAVLVVYGKSDPSDLALTDVFLNGFRFPEK